LKEGEDQVIECDSIQSTEWFFISNKYSIEETVNVKELPNIKIGQDNSIFIEGVNRENQGEYECTGINDQYERFFSSVYVNVRGKFIL